MRGLRSGQCGALPLSPNTCQADQSKAARALSQRLSRNEPLTTQVTCMFYLIDATTKDVVEGGKAMAEQRPPWLGGAFVPPFLTSLLPQCK